MKLAKGRISRVVVGFMVAMGVILAGANRAAAQRIPAAQGWAEVGGDAGFGVIGGDLFTTFEAGICLQEGDLSLGLEAALRVRTVDRRDPQDSALRREDWDEPSDFAHIIRYLSYRKELRRLKLGVQLGELSLVDVGHGSLVSGYTSVVDLDHPHSGLRLRAIHKWFQVDAMVDDFVGPELVASRASVNTGLGSLRVGVSGMVDFNSPVDVRTDDEGRRLFSKTRNLEVESRAMGFVGVDAEYGLKIGGKVEITSYVDANLAVGRGFGLHAGLDLKWRTDESGLAVSGGAEYRLAVDGYFPGYADLFYDIQRFQVGLGTVLHNRPGAERPKQALLEEQEGVAHGGKWWAKVSVGKRFWLKAAYELRAGSILGDMAVIEVGLPLGRRLVFAFVGARTGMSHKRDWKSSDGSLASGELRVRILRYLYVIGQFGYLYALDEDGVYQGNLMANGGVGGSFGY